MSTIEEFAQLLPLNVNLVLFVKWLSLSLITKLHEVSNCKEQNVNIVEITLTIAVL